MSRCSEPQFCEPGPRPPPHPLAEAAETVKIVPKVLIKLSWFMSESIRLTINGIVSKSFGGKGKRK